MKQINDTLKYEGGHVLPHILYTAGKFILVGKVDFQVFGKIKMNGVQIQNIRMTVNLNKPTEFEILTNSALLFSQAPHIAKNIVPQIPVPDVPEYIDTTESMIRSIVEEYFHREISPATASEASTQPELEDDYDEYADYDELPEIDTDSLVAEIQAPSDSGIHDMERKDDNHSHLHGGEVSPASAEEEIEGSGGEGAHNADAAVLSRVKTVSG